MLWSRRNAARNQIAALLLGLKVIIFYTIKHMGGDMSSIQSKNILFPPFISHYKCISSFHQASTTSIYSSYIELF